MQLILSLLSPLLILSLAGCETFIPKHNLSMRVEDEVVAVKVVKPGEDVGPTYAPKALGPIAAVVLPIVVDLAIKKVGSELDAESKRYTADYSGFVAEHGFYTDDGKVSFTAIDIRRKVKGEDAISILLSVNKDQQPVNGMLQLTAEQIVLNYAKAKIADSAWYLPWTWGNKAELDLDINVTLEAQWVDDKRKGHSEIVANLDIPIRGLAFGNNMNVSGGVQGFSTTPSAWFPAIPVTAKEANKDNKSGNGTYVVKVKITEYDDFGKRVKKLSDYVESNRESWVSKLKTSLSE